MTVLDPLPRPVEQAVLLVSGTRLYLLGGKAASGAPLVTVISIDPATGQRVPPACCRRRSSGRPPSRSAPEHSSSTRLRGGSTGSAEERPSGRASARAGSPCTCSPRCCRPTGASAPRAASRCAAGEGSPSHGASAARSTAGSSVANWSSSLPPRRSPARRTPTSAPSTIAGRLYKTLRLAMQGKALPPRGTPRRPVANGTYQDQGLRAPTVVAPDTAAPAGRVEPPGCPKPRARVEAKERTTAPGGAGTGGPRQPLGLAAPRGCVLHSRQCARPRWRCSCCSF